MTTIKIDAGVKALDMLVYGHNAANMGYEEQRILYETVLIGLNAAQPQPEVTDVGRKAALNDFDGAVGTATTDYASRDITHEMYPLDAVTVETIRAALSAAPVQEVTVEKIRTDIHKLMPNYLQEGIGSSMGDVITVLLTVMQMNGLRIVRGEGDKS